MLRIVSLVIVFWTFSSAQSLNWTQEERAIIASHPLKCVTTSTWPPFNTLRDEKLAGIGIDYWKKISERLGIDYHCEEVENWGKVLESIRTRHADVTLAAQPTADREHYAVFSKAYAEYPFAIVTRNNLGFINDIHMVKEKQMVVGKGYTIDHVLQTQYPYLHVRRVDSLRTALEAVKRGKAFAAIDALPVVAYMLNKEDFGSLKISGVLRENFSSHIMLRKDYAAMIPLIDKAIDSITADEKDQINRKWITVRQQSTLLSGRNLYLMLITLAGLLAWLYIRTHRLKKEIGQKELDMQKLETLATVDSLTHIYNRQMMDTVLMQQMAAAERYRQLLSVIFFDIDDFKGINDTFGHNVGDDVLIELSQIVSDTIRESDIFGRWGGDEFLVILPKSSERQARRLVDVLRKKILEHSFKGAENVSCSFGVVSYQFGDTTKTLLGRADVHLYESKEHKPSNKGYKAA